MMSYKLRCPSCGGDIIISDTFSPDFGQGFGPPDYRAVATLQMSHPGEADVLCRWAFETLQDEQAEIMRRRIKSITENLGLRP